MKPDTHDHDGHSHGLGGVHSTNAPLKALVGALVITAVVFLAELVGGIVSGSLALLSDAMHMLSDSTGLVLALVAMVIGKREASNRATYGHRRVEVIAALVNSVTVIAVVVWILIEAIGRLGHDGEIDTGLMIGIGLIGLIANAASAWILSSQRDASLNLQGAFLHVLADMLGSVAVIMAGVVIHVTGWLPADTVASLIIVALVLPRAIRLLVESTEVLLERVPRGLDVADVEKQLAAVPGVTEVHDLHIWSTDGTTPLATCHLVLDPDREPGCHVLDTAQARLEQFGITHSTIQLEEPEHAGHEDVCH